MKINRRNNRLFITLISLFITILTIVFIITYNTYVYVQEENFKNEMSNDTQRLVKGANSILSIVENYSFQIVMSPTLNKMIYDSNSVTKYDYIQLKQDMSQYFLFNNLFNSAYIYLKNKDQVLTSGEGLFKYEDFYDKDFLNMTKEEDSKTNYFVFRRLGISFFHEKERDIFSLVRNIPIASDSNDGKSKCKKTIILKGVFY